MSLADVPEAIIVVIACPGAKGKFLKFVNPFGSNSSLPSTGLYKGLISTDHLGLDLGKSMFIVVVSVIAGSVLMEKFIK